MTEYIKDFDGWGNKKPQIHNDKKIPTFNQREVWWCSTGVNVGIEQDGKNNLYERPVLVVRKFNRRLFWGVPLSTQTNNFPHNIPILFKDRNKTTPKERTFVVSQMRAYDSCRLTRPLGKLTPLEFKLVTSEIETILTKAK
jgi:mRNA interferase MazF